MERGGVLRTVDGAETFKPAKGFYGRNADALRVEFKDAFTGWIHGQNDDEWITTDGGVKWTSQDHKVLISRQVWASNKKP